MFTSRFMPCSQCGASVERSKTPEHRCHPERVLDSQMFVRREEVAAFETLFRDHLGTSTGRFQMWLAARQVRGHES